MSTVFTVLQDKFKEQIKVLQDALYANRVGNIEDYRHITGQLRGLTVALNITKDLEAKVENDELED